MSIDLTPARVEWPSHLRGRAARRGRVVFCFICCDYCACPSARPSSGIDMYAAGLRAAEPVGRAVEPIGVAR